MTTTTVRRAPEQRAEDSYRAAPPTRGRPPRPGPRRVLRVLVQDGDALTRAGVVALLRESPDLLPVALEDGPPDVALVLLDAVTRQGVAAVRRLAGTPGVRIVLLVGEVSSDGVAIALQAGAVGLLRRREATPESLGQLVRSVAAGDAVVPPDLLSALLPRRREPGPGLGNAATVPRLLALAGLNDREIDVLRMLGEGADTREIARRLCYSERTVKTIIQDVIRRFGLRNRAHAVGYAVRHGLI